MSDLTVRQATTEDIDFIANLEQICFSDPWSRESIREEIEDNDLAMYIIGEVEGEVVGYAGIWWIAGEGHITNVAVSPAYRKRHIGEAIVSSMVDFAKQEGISVFTLEVRVSNIPAQKLYGKLGFESVGIRPGYYKDGESAMIMWLTEE